ncbi:hypothetical protein ACLB2K_022409 [Fragaria x ananassa]
MRSNKASCWEEGFQSRRIPPVDLLSAHLIFETLRDRVKDTGEHLTVYNHCCSTMTSDYAFTQEELNISDGVGYPNAYAELCRHCRAGLYSHGPPFTFMPYCLQQQQWFQKRHKKAMTEALEKIKAELMLLGFVSLLLTVGT